MRHLVVVVLLAVASPVRAAPRIVPQLGHTDTVRHLAVSPDGKYVASGGRDGEVKLWELASGALLWSAAHPRREIGGVAFSLDGKSVVTAGTDASVRIWELATGSPIRATDVTQGEVRGLAVLPDGKRAVLIAADRVLVWDLERGVVLREIAPPPPTTSSRRTVAGQLDRLVVTSDGKRALVLRDGETFTFDVDTGGLLKTVPLALIAASPDGTRILARDKEVDRTLLWDASAGRAITALPFRVDRAVFASDGRAIFAATDKEVVLLSRDGAITSRWAAEARAIAVARDGSRLVTSDEGIAVWDPARPAGSNLVRTFAGRRRAPITIAWSPDGRHLLVGELAGAVRLWDASSGALERTIAVESVPIVALAYAGDGSRAAWSASREAVVWDARSGSVTRWSLPASVEHLAFAPDGKRLYASLDNSPKVFVRDLADGRVAEYEERLYAGQLGAGPIAISRDGKRIVHAKQNGGYALVYDAATGGVVEVVEIPLGCAALAFSPDGKELRGVAAHKPNAAWVHALGKSGKAVEIASPHGLFPTAAYSHDGKLVAIGGVGDATSLNAAPRITLVDLAARKAVRSLAGHANPARGMAFSADGRHLASTSLDGTVRLWNVVTGASLTLIASDREWLAIADDGVFDASRRGGTLVAAVEGLVAYRVEQLAAQLNRPDVLLGRVGLGAPDALEHYKARRTHRLAKLGLADKAVSFSSAPGASIAAATVAGATVKLEISLAAAGADLAFLRISVNDVPVFGGKGKPVAGRRASAVEVVPLLPGANRIEVSAVDTDGAESLRVYRDITHAGEDRGALYFVGFGVSRYRDRSLDLAYAHKDALDLERLFALGGRRFSAVHTKAFIDDQATVANLRAAKTFLSGTRTEDTVIVFVAGHGTYTDDASADYYFVTHEADVKRLRETAAPFDLVEDLLAGIPARRKLLLLDTCESGERTSEALAPPAPGARKLKPRTARALVRVPTTQVPAHRPYLYDRERFIYNDLTRRTGAVVFSSSQGSELSYELAALENGAFTYAIVQALTGDDAWMDLDALRAAVAPAVAALTDQRQHPTIDRDNPAISIRLPRVKPP